MASVKSWQTRRASQGSGSYGVRSVGDFGAGRPDRGVRLPDGTLADERGEREPAPGEPFVVYRLGRSTSKDLHSNAGNADGVALHLARVDDFEKPAFSGGVGDTIHAFRVVVPERFTDYSAIVAGRPTHGGAAKEPGVGRTETKGRVSYSFPPGAKFKAELIASVPLDAVRSILEQQGFRAGSFDESGSRLGASAIRAAFKEG